MGKITAPYNFVPLNEYVYIPSWGSQISQDVPFEDGEDGYIEVTWRNVSPLCVRDASDSYEKSKDSKVYYSMNMRQPDGSRLYFLPGSSLRGMLRNTLNIMSFGKMTQYGNKYFGHREFDTKKPGGQEYQNKMRNAKCGWLEKVSESYLLHECKHPASKISIEDELIENYGEDFTKEKSAWKRNEALKRKALAKNEQLAYGNFCLCERNGVEYAIFATGAINTKLHEQLIPVDTKAEPVPLSDDDITAFFTVYENTPDFENFREMLDSGRQIPVTYVKDGDRFTLGMGRMIRDPHKYSIRDLAKQDLCGSLESAPDLAEAIFGWVDKDSRKAHKGRVQVGNAFSEKPIADAELCGEVSGVLGSPKPSFYPLYVEQDKAPYKTYSTDDARISGKKQYRIHKGGTTMQLPKGNGNEATLSYFRPIPVGQEFKMRIMVHNLRKVEIGALLSAITYHHAKGVYHNIGSAKGYGYGKLEWHDIKLHGLQHTEEEYLTAYEYELSIFAKMHFAGFWKDTKQIARLAAIMSEHEDDELRMMEMDKKKSPIGENEYSYYSKNTNFSRLEERPKGVREFLDDTDKTAMQGEIVRRRNEERLLKEKLEEERRQMEIERRNALFAKRKEDFKLVHASDYALVKAKEAGEEYSDAISMLNKLIDELDRQRLDKAEEESWLAELQKKEKEKAAAKAEADAAADEARRKEKAEKPFAEVLEEKYEGKDKYKVDKWKTCESKVKQRLKAQERDTLTPEDCDDLETTIRRLYKRQDRSEKKEWTKPLEQSKICRSIARYLGEERVRKLYEELTNGDGK